MKIIYDPKFWTALVDTVVSIVLYFASKYAAPSIAEDIRFLIAALQPIVLIVIVWLVQKQEITMRYGGDVPKFLR